MEYKVQKKPKKDTQSKVVIHSGAKDPLLIKKKQQQIVDNVKGTLFEKGFHPTTMRMIGKACGMSMGQLYHYVSTKDDVLYLVHRDFYERIEEYLRIAKYKEIKDPVLKFVVALRSILEFIAENKQQVRFALSESKYLKKKQLKAVSEMYQQNIIEFLDGLLLEIDKKIPLSQDVEFLARFIGHVTTFIAFGNWAIGKRSRNEGINFMMNITMRGLGLQKNSERIP